MTTLLLSLALTGQCAGGSCSIQQAPRFAPAPAPQYGPTIMPAPAPQYGPAYGSVPPPHHNVQSGPFHKKRGFGLRRHGCGR